MWELFRFFRIGIVNLIGITLPGLLVITFATIALFLPLMTLFLNGIHIGFQAGVPDGTLLSLKTIYADNKFLLISLYIIFSYIIGSVVRLSSPDQLDKISANRVLKTMAVEQRKKEKPAAGYGKDLDISDKQAAVADGWPYQGEDGDQFPYNHFKEYLVSRGLDELTRLVTWRGAQSGPERRTKTRVNMIKLDIEHQSPELAAVIESNEAHVRLLFGTWQAIRACGWLFYLGFAACVAGITLNIAVHHSSLTHANTVYAVCLALIISLKVGIEWARKRIEHQFHYQRVRELTHIIGCKHYLDKLLESNQRQVVLPLSTLQLSGKSRPNKPPFMK